jgi:hypothetical protein
MYNLSAGEMIILSHLTHLEARVLEQSLIYQFSPKLNSEKEVVFTYTSWNPSTLDLVYNLKTPNAVTIEVLLEDTKEILITYPSIQKAATGLGASTTTINKYLNKSYSFESTSLELNVLVRTPNGTISDSPIVYPKAKQLHLIDYDLNSLEEGYIYALDSTKSNCVYKFDDVIIATKRLDPTKWAREKDIKQLGVRHISRYLNLEKLVKTELGNYYFVCNPNHLTKLRAKWAPKEVWAINLTTGVALKYDSLLKASKDLNLSWTMSRHLDKYTIYKDTYQFFSHNKFKELFPNVKGTTYECDFNKLPLIKK